MGTHEKMGGLLQLNLVLLFLGLLAHWIISSTDRAPLAGSVIDQSLVVSALSFLGHLHQRQEKVEAKPPTPVT